MADTPEIEIDVGGVTTVFGSGDAPVVIGRAETADVVVGDSFVSGQHATVEVVNGAWHLVDRSSHGTFVDGQPVDDLAVDGPIDAWLADPVTGTRISIRPRAVAGGGTAPAAPPLTARVGPGDVLTFPADGGPVTIGRGRENSVVVADESVSAAHGFIEPVAGGWVYHDTSSYGTYVNGQRVDEVAVGDPVTLNLSSVDGPTVVVSATAGLGGSLRGALADGATRPAPTGNVLRVTYPEGTTRELVPGQEVVVGRDAEGGDADLRTSADNDLVSRRHARITFDGSAWQLVDLDSRRGTYVDGVRVKRQKLTGEVIAWLGSPSTGESLVFEAEGVHRRRLSPKLIGLAALLVVLLAGIVAVLVVSLTGDDVVADPAGNDVTRMKLATGLVISDYGDGAAKGSSTVLCGDNLVLTNAHVARPDAPGQGLLYGSADEPVEQIFLAYPPADDPDGIVEIRYRAEVVAYDGYIDAAVLRIVGEASGQYPDVVAGAGIADAGTLELPCAELPESGVVPGKTAVDVFGYPGTTASEDRSRFFDVQLDADSNEITSYTEDVLLGERRGWVNLGRDIQGGNSGGLVARNNEILGVPTRGGGDAQRLEISSQARPIDLARRVVDAARSGRTGDIADYLTPLTGNEVFEASVDDPGGCVQVALDSVDNPTVDFVLSWRNVDDDAHVLVLVDSDRGLLYREHIGRSPEGQGVLSDADCIAFSAAPADVSGLFVLGGPNLEFVTGFDLGGGG